MNVFVHLHLAGKSALSQILFETSLEDVAGSSDLSGAARAWRRG